MDFIQSLLPAIEHFQTLGYWFVLLVALLETTIGVGLFIPGSTIILFMGSLAAGGYFDWGDLIWFAAIGAIIGDNINYFIGRKYGSQFFIKGFWFIKPDYFKKGREFFNIHGSKSVFIGRFIPSIKEVAPLIAGTFKMKQVNFMVWNVLGAVGWSFVWVFSGYFFVQSLDLAKIWLTRMGFFLIVLLVIFIIFYILKIILIKRGKEFFSFLFSLWQSIKEAIINNDKIQSFVKQHNNFFIFIQKRLDKRKFSGLPLTLLLLSLIYVFSLLGGVIEDIIRLDTITFVDVRVLNLLAIFRYPSLVQFFFWITLLGKWQVIFVFTIGVSLILWVWRRKFYIIPLFISMVGSESFTLMGKNIFHRPRPELAIYTEKSFSFPSGHATIAVAFYGFLAYVLIKNIKQWKRRVNIFFLTFILILLIGFSRIYLGVHYLSDVWGGYLVGGFWLIIAISFSEYFLDKKPFQKKNNLNKKNVFQGLVIIFLTIVFYISFSNLYQIPVLNSLQKKKENPIVSIDNLPNVLINNKLEYTETILGNQQEPISFIIMAHSDNQIINLFKKSGWHLSDAININTLGKIGRSVLLNQPYLNAPITPDFWNMEVNNFSFEKTTKLNNIRQRHHSRFWKTNFITKNRGRVYVGVASFDNGIKWGITHKINPDIDTERDFMFNDLQKTGMLKNIKKQQFVNARLGNNFTGDLFFTDGKVYILEIK